LDLTPEAVGVAGPWQWRWLLTDDRTGAALADHVVALGGGVVGDLAGFCAATYQRGVPVVQVPTSLVAQVDSAYGGKTGVDLREAKNYVGVYHQPAGVLVDPDTLATLPAVELAAGWVEVLKTALIAGGKQWERVAAGGEVEEQMILACVRTKLEIVAADERDGGRRQVLNLGHTVGHAIETATGYARYRHGEAVGLGLLATLRPHAAPAGRAAQSDRSDHERDDAASLCVDPQFQHFRDRDDRRSVASRVGEGIAGTRWGRARRPHGAGPWRGARRGGLREVPVQAAGLADLHRQNEHGRRRRWIGGRLAPRRRLSRDSFCLRA